MDAIRSWLFASGSDYRVQSDGQVRIREQILAALIGALALFLAFAVAWLDGKTGPVCPRSSISHYYYEPLAGTFFVMALTFVGAFMMAYRGRNRAENVAATIGGVGALVVAFFPTDGLGCAVGHLGDFRPALSFVVPEVFADGARPATFDVAGTTAEIGNAFTQTWHFRGAGVLFAVLLLFTAVLFPWLDPENDTVPDPFDPSKRRVRIVKWVRRIVVYWPMAVVMALGLYMIAASESDIARSLSAWLAQAIADRGIGLPEAATVVRPVYHGELLALMAFGVSWLVKGRIWLGWLDRYLPF